MKKHYDAIVIGSGISGGYAAMELCKKGYKTLMLERGREVKHGEYPTAFKDKWDFPNQGEVSLEEKNKHYEKQSRLSWWVKEEVKHFINKDDEYPYDEDARFDWIRGHHLGGRSVMWGRHSPRWSEHDFQANKRDAIAVDWPIRYADIEPWYDYVEPFVGIAGQAEGLKQAPDGKFLPPFPLNTVEKAFRERVKDAFGNRVVTPCRTANISEYDPEVHKGARGPCQNRNRCKRGCPFGAFFSTQSATLPVAMETGNLTVQSDSIVMEIIYDEKTKKASGVKVKDANSTQVTTFEAKVIFCNASTIGTAAILLNSRSKTFPNGLGNTSGELGHNLMDHHYNMGASGTIDGFEEDYYQGRKPKGFYIPPFVNIDEETKHKDFIRNFGYQGGASRITNNPDGLVGADLKTEILKPGPWRINLHCFGEMLPYHENKMYLNFDKRDKHGMPIITFDASLGENEMKIREHGIKSAVEMLEASGCRDIRTFNRSSAPGACIHEMGTARMGHDATTSVLNKWNQMHDVPNVFVTDGACMTSSGTQNPSITYMALTARAVDYAHKQLASGAI